MKQRYTILGGLMLSAVAVVTAAAVSFSDCDKTTTTSASATYAPIGGGGHCSSDAQAEAAYTSGDACCAGKMAGVDMKKPLQATFAVENVDCDDCVKKIGKAVKGVKGVKKYQFDKEHNALMVAFMPSKTNCQEIASAVTTAGYPAKMNVVTAFDGKLVCPTGAGGADCERACPTKGKETKSSSTSM
jgi:copper chaperone CopZ